MNALKILILDSGLNQVSLLTNCISMTFKNMYNSIGGFEIKVNLNQLNATELTPGRFIYIDSKETGVLIGLIETVSVNHTTNMMGEVLVASGCELKDIIKRRVCLAPTGEGENSFEATTTESIIYQLIDRCIINPEDTNRKISLFSNAALKGLGNTRNFETVNYSLAYDIYNQLLPLDELGFRCVPDLTNKTAVLEVYRGLDRTIDQDENTVAVFSLKLGTSIQSHKSWDESAVSNFIYSGNYSTGVDKKIVTLPEQNPPEGFDRFEELIVNGGYSVTDDELKVFGQTALNNSKNVITVYGLAGTIEPDYEMGDKVSFLDYRENEYMNLRVSGIEYIYSKINPLAKRVYFGSTPADIAKVFKAKVAPLEKEHVK